MPETGLEPALLSKYAPETYASTNSAIRAIYTLFKLSVSTTRLELARLAAPPPQSGVSTNSTTWTCLFSFCKITTFISYSENFFHINLLYKILHLVFQDYIFLTDKIFSFDIKQKHSIMAIFLERNTIFENIFVSFSNNVPKL